MTIEPSPAYMTPAMITPWSPLALGTEIAAIAASAPASGAWSTGPSTNGMLGIPFVLPNTFLVQKHFWLNGATAAGNIEVAVYDAAYNRVSGASATVAQGTINVLQEQNPTDYTLSPGQYYLVLAASGSTATFFRVALSSLQIGKGFGMWQQTSLTLGSLPSPATPVVITGVMLPFFGIAGRVLAA